MIKISNKISLYLSLFFLILSWLVLSVPGFTFDNKSDQSKLSAVKHSGYFLIHYDPSDPYLAERIASIANDELARISKDLGYKPSKYEPFIVYVYAVHYDFIKEGGLQSQKFTVGTTSGEHAKISVDASGSFDQPQTIVAHELTHAIIFRILGPNTDKLPLWFNEGMAKFESGGSDSTDHTLLIDAASDGTALSLSEISKHFPEKTTSLAYAESVSAIEFLTKKYGKSAPRKILNDFAATGSLDKAMKTATGKDVSQFSEEWFERINKSYAVIRMGKTAMAIISLLMASLAIAAYFRRKQQKIEAAKRWEQEEFEEALRKQQGNDWSK